MKPNRKILLETILYSSLGVTLVFILLVAINVIAGLYPLRLDLTQEKAYTLSEGTKQLLKSLDAPIKIRFYCTRSETATPEVVFLRSFARRVEDLLSEYKQIAGRKLIIEKYDPQPDSDAEDSAKMDGLVPRQLPAVDKFYLGLCVSLGDQRETIPFIEPTMERLLEYQITRAIARVVNPKKPVIGVISSLPVFGLPVSPFRQSGQQPMETWAIINELRFDYEVRRLETDLDKIDDEIHLLMVIHPKNLNEKTQYAIDQFLMRGGRLMIFVDPLSVVDNRVSGGIGSFSASSSNLEKLFKAWGYNFDSTKAVADVSMMLQVRSRTGLTENAPVWLNVSGTAINATDIATSGIDSIWLPVAGAFTGQAVDGLKETVLLQSTEKSQLVDAFLANLSGSGILRDFKPSGVKYKLAIRLTGKFKTAFPEGMPSETSTNQPSSTNQARTEHLKESIRETSVVLFGDADFLYDDFMLRRIDTPFGQLVALVNGNLALIANLVDQLAGDTRLVAIRSRADVNKPFTKIRAMVAEAEQQYQAEIKRLEDVIAETERRINELQAQKTDPNQKFILTPEQRAEIEKLRREEAQTRQRLKEVRKQLTSSVRKLENRIKWINMLAMPLTVAIIGIVVGVIRSKRTAAK
jgi:ABC-type uncharacterized transport system involved in gliding motility auxiliary subunit